MLTGTPCFRSPGCDWSFDDRTCTDQDLMLEIQIDAMNNHEDGPLVEDVGIRTADGVIHILAEAEFKPALPLTVISHPGDELNDPYATLMLDAHGDYVITDEASGMGYAQLGPYPPEGVNEPDPLHGRLQWIDDGNGDTWTVKRR